RHRRFTRMGNVPLNLKKRFEVDDETYRYEVTTRGYYYELANPIAVNVSEGRIMGEVKKPITAFMRKPGVDYSEPPSSGDATATTAPAPAPAGESGAETAPELGP